MYRLYTDKSELFEAKVELSGASPDKSFCRLVLESDNWNIAFPGKIGKEGKVRIPIRKLKPVFSEKTTGKIKLEVIAEDTFFVPWESDFKVFTDKKVKVEVIDKSKNQNQASVKVEVLPESVQVKSNTHDRAIVYECVKDYTKILKKFNVHVENLEKKKETLDKINEVFFKKHKLTKEQLQLFTEQIPEIIKKLPYKDVQKSK